MDDGWMDEIAWWVESEGTVSDPGDSKVGMGYTGGLSDR